MMDNPMELENHLIFISPDQLFLTNHRKRSPLPNIYPIFAIFFSEHWWITLVEFDIQDGYPSQITVNALLSQIFIFMNTYGLIN